MGKIPALGEALTRQQVKYRLKMDHYPDFKLTRDG